MTILNEIFDDKRNQLSINKKFAFPGSIIHNIPILSFTIEHMALRIKPDFVNRFLINCEQRLRIKTLRDISAISLDIADIMIHDVNSTSSSVSKFECIGNTSLVIEFSEVLEKGKTNEIRISYSAGYYEINGKKSFNPPRKGFHFITNSKQDAGLSAYQAWTQGEADESPYWFPCIDTPEVKFTLEIEISSPEEFMVISNGSLESKSARNKLTIWKYLELTPLPAYLISVVIGKFSMEESKYGDIPLYYYWPDAVKKDDAMLTFIETPQMLSFFEEYFDTKYPFHKYSQSAVDNFEFGGMENSSCTTLTRRVLHDKTVSKEYKNDILLVCHELAHQWFGNLVTCRDWSHIWLNEGFATYSESLYWEKTRGVDEFHYNLIESSDVYFEESNENYARPIVTNYYKHPDELFDAHSYEKAGFVLHMIRNHLGEETFKKSLKIYLEKYRNKSTESTDLLNIFEKTSGKEMQSFFDQWIFKKGHPELDIEISLLGLELNKNSPTNKLKIKIVQHPIHGNDTEYPRFSAFYLEIRIQYLDIYGQDNNQLVSMKVDGDISEHEFDILSNSTIKMISIDPFYKILKEIKSIKILNETRTFQLKTLLINQLYHGNTVIERINATRSLRNMKLPAIMEHLQVAIVKDRFYGVSIEAANTIGSFYDKNDYENSEIAFRALFDILKDKKTFDTLRSEVKSAVVKNIGIFRREESVEFLKERILDSEDESSFVKSSAAVAIGKSCVDTSTESKKAIISLLKELVESTDTFQNILATGALDGLKELSKDKDETIFSAIAEFLIKSTNESNDYFIRAKATSTLSKFITNRNELNGHGIDATCSRVFETLLKLLMDSRRKIRMNACSALVDEDTKFRLNPDQRTFQILEALIRAAKYDMDGFVRRKAEACVNNLRAWINEWSNKPVYIKDSTEV